MSGPADSEIHLLLNPDHVGSKSEIQTFEGLMALANEHYALYLRSPNDTTLDQVINHFCAAFDLGPSPGGTTDYVNSYFRLRHAVLLRAQAQNGHDDTIITDKYLDKALSFTPPGHHLRPVLLGLRGASYTARYKHTQDVADLNLALETFQTVIDFISEGHPQLPHLLMQYGSVLQTRYLATKDEDDLNLAIQQFQRVLASCPSDLLVPARRSLATALDQRARLRYDNETVDLAIEAYASVIDLLLKDQLESFIASIGYSTLLRTRFYRKGDLDDLNTSIRHSDFVFRRCPPGHKYYFQTLVFHATLLIARSEAEPQRDPLEDVDKAIECLRSGLKICPPGDPSRPELLGNLGYSLVSRFSNYGNATDLESAVESCYDAVSSQSDGSGEAGVRAYNMNRLAFTLFSRYQLQGDETDASHAKAYLQQALQTCPLGDPNRLGILNNYARTLGNLARRKSDLDDLDLSVKYFYEALELCYATARCTVLTNLALVLIFRFSQVGDISDVDVAFSLCKAALELRQEGHPLRGMIFLIQAKSVICQLSRKHGLPDVEMAIDILHAARDSFTPGHPLLIETYQELSSTYSHRYAITNRDSDLEEAFEYRMAATKHSNGGSKSQFEAAMRWVQDAETFGHSSTLAAYKSAIHLVDLHLVLKPSVDLRHDIIKTAALSVCADATSCALRHGDVVGAVEMFEHSRGLFWTHIGRLRTPLDELRASGPVGEELAGEFESLSRQLEVPVTLEDNGEQGQRFRRLQKDWTAVVDKIRSMDGFDKFLLPPSYADLQAAANGGPVIILNASRYSCDAIVVLANDAPIHIPFPEGTFSEVVSMSSEFSRLLVRQEESNNESSIAVLLRRLWQTIVYEVVRALEPHLPKNSRIWWCPTGPFTSLPLHAAHPYRKGEPGLSDLYVSSYTPTLSALIRSRNKRSEPPSTPSFLSIGQPNSTGYELLLSVRQELDAVHQLLPDEVQLTELIDEAATREAVLTALSTHTYAHLACHGEQVPERPFDSHFAMHDGHLSLLDIIRSQLGHETEFAFLSACKTATGDGDAPDEVIHLAAAMQFAGVRNVVGTMWSVDDRVVVRMVQAFYRAMIREDGMFDPARAARALRVATRSTMDRVPLDQRIVFIHIGI